MHAINNDPLPMKGQNSGLPVFMVSMLLVAYQVTANEPERSEITNRQLSRLMQRYHHKLPRTYTAKQIAENLYQYGGEISDSDVMIEWHEVIPKDGRKMAQYHFRIKRVYEPERTTIG